MERWQKSLRDCSVTVQGFLVINDDVEPVSNVPALQHSGAPTGPHGCCLLHPLVLQTPYGWWSGPVKYK